jgi:hypothetical protein
MTTPQFTSATRSDAYIANEMPPPNLMVSLTAAVAANKYTVELVNTTTLLIADKMRVEWHPSKKDGAHDRGELRAFKRTNEAFSDLPCFTAPIAMNPIHYQVQYSFMNMISYFLHNNA